MPSSAKSAPHRAGSLEALLICLVRTRPVGFLAVCGIRLHPSTLLAVPCARVEGRIEPAQAPAPTRRKNVAPSTTNRWQIALAGVVMQVALGAVYAWSVFRTPLTKAFNWTIPQVTLTFTIAIFVL